MNWKDLLKFYVIYKIFKPNAPRPGREDLDPRGINKVNFVIGAACTILIIIIVIELVLLHFFTG